MNRFTDFRVLLFYIRRKYLFDTSYYTNEREREREERQKNIILIIAL